MTRCLRSGKGLAHSVDEKDLVVAKEIVRRRFIVGLMSDMEEWAFMYSPLFAWFFSLIWMYAWRLRSVRRFNIMLGIDTNTVKVCGIKSFAWLNSYTFYFTDGSCISSEQGLSQRILWRLDAIQKHEFKFSSQGSTWIAWVQCHCREERTRYGPVQIHTVSVFRAEINDRFVHGLRFEPMRSN